MAIIRAQVRLPFVGGGPGDVSINTWHFNMTTFADADLTPVTVALGSFYTSVKPMYSSDVNFASGNVTYYNLADPKPRPPIKEVSLGTTTTGGAGGGPQEIAICLSFYGLKVAGEPFARRRGRIFLGPLSISTIQSLNVPSTNITTIIGAATTFLGASNAAAWDWAVYSPTQDLTPLGGFGPSTPVIGGWVDNAWDVQRRRGLEPSARTTFGLTPAG